MALALPAFRRFSTVALALVAATIVNASVAASITLASVAATIANASVAATIANASVAVTIAHADVAVPALTARVTDLTGTLNASQRASLEQKLEAFENRKGSQIAVLIVPTTEPEDIEQYSIRVVDAWKLGRKGVDDGALLLVAKNDRKLRIEVGRGLEGVVPDIAAKRIVADTITPRFRGGDFYGGIDAGVTQLIGLVDGEPLPAPRREWSREPQGDFGGVFPILLVLVIFVGGVLRRLVGRLPGAFATGGIVGMAAWLLVGLIAAGVAAGLLAFFATLMGFSSGPGWSSRRRGGFGGPMGGWGHGGFGGGGFGGGGFGGGGGGFSGGGASGRW
jgi:uncharacterized protein